MSNRHVWSNIDPDGQRVWNVTTYTKDKYTPRTLPEWPRFQGWKDAVKWALHLYSIGEKPVDDRRVLAENTDDWPCLTCNRASPDCCNPWETPQEHAHD
ncbi:hypothetical protein QP456_11135 [Corynebacterium amycolatum]|uniref:hypothetical protein n=1 Tax=Corynebacterium amycolatum TaxID=43765 RepID=UPI00254E3FD2|nr:hypothetical protein [Corynebacterium amycolatum]MDK7238678.1 hypothetical protein [Corynebacterium amycolatum]MDK7248763.1 hypothetical protein [Corynebacterium amycolatum]